MDAEEYKKNPCGAASLPFWKAESIQIPGNMRIFREDAFPGEIRGGTDEVYFKTLHRLDAVKPAALPEGFELVTCGTHELARHICECYERERISASELLAYREHPVYDPGLWIAVREKNSRKLAASGIAELDSHIGEGVLEWIQVSPDCRRRHLGEFVVCELLRRMREKADFATVSGRADSPSDPLALYTACGFADTVLWHIVTLSETG